MLKTFKEFTNDNNQVQDLLNKLINLSMERYAAETKDFFDNLSSKDPDIRNILDQLNQGKNEPDVVSKNASDSNFGNGEV